MYPSRSGGCAAPGAPCGWGSPGAALSAPRALYGHCRAAAFPGAELMYRLSPHTFLPWRAPAAHQAEDPAALRQIMLPTLLPRNRALAFAGTAELQC